MSKKSTKEAPADVAVTSAEVQAVIDQAAAERAAEAAEFAGVEVFTPNTEKELVDHMQGLGLSAGEVKANMDELDEIKPQPTEPGFAIPAPTIGRVVWAVDFIQGNRRIRKADVCFVHEDGRVNLAITNHDGTTAVAIGVHELGHYASQPIGWEWPARV